MRSASVTMWCSVSLLSFPEGLMSTYSGSGGSRIKAWEETWQTLFHEFTNVAEDKSYVRFAPNAKADEPDEDDY